MCASEQEREDIKQKRYEYRKWLDLIDIHNLVFVDESGVNLGMTRAYGRGTRGERVVTNTPRNRGRNTSVLGALSIDGLIASMTVIGSTNKKIFEVYIEQILVPQLWPGAIVLMDNLSIHKGPRIEELINSAGAKLIFLPAYSPDLSPIELCWSKFKNFLRSYEARTSEQLDRVISLAIAQITEDDAVGWFEHCGLFI
ncbi:IS630 family transposase [Okeania sp. KiyG1]|uniref:IS630 family transposase n=1 Tax=Okeania sp. KiyG1 TaxID=2720165 RepID=UPI0019225A58|nr:IS630 family transposase [Okeania sp. KiyG1]